MKRLTSPIVGDCRIVQRSIGCRKALPAPLHRLPSQTKICATDDDKLSPEEEAAFEEILKEQRAPLIISLRRVY